MGKSRLFSAVFFRGKFSNSTWPRAKKAVQYPVQFTHPINKTEIHIHILFKSLTAIKNLNNSFKLEFGAKHVLTSKLLKLTTQMCEVLYQNQAHVA